MTVAPHCFLRMVELTIVAPRGRLVSGAGSIPSVPFGSPRSRGFLRSLNSLSAPVALTAGDGRWERRDGPWSVGCADTQIATREPRGRESHFTPGPFFASETWKPFP